MKNLKLVGGINLKVIIVSSIVLLVFGLDVSHAGNISAAKDTSDKIEKAEAMLKLNENREALYLVSRIKSQVDSDSQRIDALFVQGKAYNNLGKYRKAIDTYSQIILMANPGLDKALAYSYRASLYKKISEFDQALLDREALKRLQNN